jgi:6-phospho-3-hexuloisomerase
MISKNISTILLELSKTLGSINQTEVDSLSQAILISKNIICCGAGRVGMSTKAFAMRLSHLGFSAYFLGDSNLPGIKKHDLLLVSSGSGETETIYQLAKKAKHSAASIALVTANPQSRIGKLADMIVNIKAPSKTNKVSGLSSIQPMTTLNEQTLFIFYDSLVLELMRLTNQKNQDLLDRHSILE